MNEDSKALVGRRGLILILSSPSGAGKTTLTRNLVEDHAGVLSVSVTTRPKRTSEIDGRHYHFIDEKKFLAMRDRDELLEWAEVHGNFYGTPREPVEKTLASGQDMVFDIDYQGTRQVREKLPDDVVTVFILPPSFRELKARLERRAEDAPEVIAKRLANARVEMERWEEYDYVIVNEDLGRSYASLKAIQAAERLKRDRLVGLEQFVQGLLAETLD
ncbi:guanylate kinase [Microvirga pudoricolor]|uniref:guanylate kinase n=1 Tax=Microvirga pudoricolor TaxID=2778729 RepID=UPI001952500F|nr:guanylate kinase [Microvirga pudoricolor]MBM6594319.1 guanylate kinase [Microvirga pudoricolor]